jgi:predicted anti-sigma-YlaC factor YlaD
MLACGEIRPPKEEAVSSETVSGGVGSKRPLVIALAIVGVVFVILAVLFFAGVGMGPLDSIGHSGKVNHGSHDIRGAVSAVIGVVALAAAWWANRKPR